ncbi:MAG: inositol monophosphatase family protein [Candidatus Delongbacteria bacterium]
MTKELLLDQPLAAALGAARAAAALLERAWLEREPLQVDRKGCHDYVTQVDRRSEALLVEQLRTACPEIGLLGEEGSHLDLDAESFWVVDPLDGTSNFVHGYPAFAVSIGLLRRVAPVDPVRAATVRFPQVLGCESVLGVIADVCRRQLYFAHRGGGAWRCDLPGGLDEPLPAAERLRVGLAPRLDEAFVATGFPIRNKDLARLYLNLFDALMPPSAGIRRGGSAALDLAYTAAGIFDAFVELQLAPWDMAAGVCLVEEAGGRLAGLAAAGVPEPEPLVNGHVLAGNPALVEDLQARLAGRL